VEEGLEGRIGDATLVEDGWRGALMVRPMVEFSAWSSAGGPVQKNEDVFEELEGVNTFVGVTGRRWSSSTEMMEGGWAIRESGGGVMLAKSRVMGWVSTGESLIMIGWSNEPFVWIVEVIEVSSDVEGAVLVGVRKRRTRLD